MSGKEFSIDPSGNTPNDENPALSLSVSISADETRANKLIKLRADQHRRFRDGAPLPVERYLDHFSAVMDDDTAIDLIYSEVMLRAEFGEEPTVDEYVKRFPQYAEALRQQFEVFQVLQSVLFDSVTISRHAGDDIQTPTESENSAVEELPTIPGYEIHSRLGRGGMGAVWKAKQLGLNRIVALKTIHVERSDEVIARFRAEAESIARLHHPNIVQIFDVGETDGKPFFAMEYVEGGNLAEFCSGSAQPIRDCAKLLYMLARAVHAAHEKSIVHRDLKPANILLQRKGDNDSEFIPKIADFGLAKQLDQGSDLTASGALLGTPNYMAPEQAEGRTDDIGPASDIHALGCILYELLTGRRAFDGKSVVDTLWKIRIEDPARPSRINPRVHSDLETICLKCLQKTPDRRYATAKDLSEDLQRFLNGEPIQARPVGRMERLRLWCRRRPAAAVAVLAVLILMFIVLPGWLWYRAELRASQETERLHKQLAVSATKAKNEADKAKNAAEELARTQEYFALVNRVKQRSTRKPLGWTWAGLKELTQAARLDVKVRDIHELRREVARSLAGVDVRLKEVWAKGLPQVIVKFSREGKYLAVVDYRAPSFVYPCAVRLLDGHTGKMIRKLSFTPSLVLKGSRPVPDGARSVAFTPNNNSLLVGTRAGKIYRWNLAKPDATPTSWKTGDTAIDWLFPTGDGKSLIVASSQDVKVARWLLEKTAEEPKAEYKAPGAINSVSLSDNGAVLAVHCWKHCTEFLEPNSLISKKNTHSLYPQNKHGWSPLVLDSAGEMLCGYHGGLMLVHKASQRMGRRMKNRGLSKALEWSPDFIALNRDASLVLTLNDDDDIRKLQIWETAGARLQSAIALPGKNFASAAFHPTKNAIIVANDGKLELYEIGGMNVQRRLANQAFPIEAFAFSSDGDRLVCIAATGEASWAARATTHWQMTTGRFIDVFPPGYRMLRGPAEKCLVALHPQDAGFALHDYEDRLGIHYTDTKYTPRISIDLPSPVNLHFDRDGQRLWAICDERKTLQTFTWPNVAKAASWQDTFRLLEGTGELYCLGAGNKYMAVGSRDGMTHLIRTNDTQLEITLAGRSSPVRSVALNQDETLAASGFQDGKVRIYRVSSGATIADLEDHDDSVESIDFSSDGKWLATGSKDGTIQLYAISGDSFTKWIAFDSGPVRQLRFHPDGRQLAFLVFGEGAIRVWDLQRLQLRLAEMGIGFD